MNYTFSIINQTINAEEADNAASNSREYLTASFSFSDDWNGANKIAYFCNNPNFDKAILVGLDANNSCFVPYELIASDKNTSVYISVVGTMGNTTITTNWTTFMVKRGVNPNEGTPGSVPTPTLISQMWEVVNTAKEEADSIVSQAASGGFIGGKGPQGEAGAAGESAYEAAKNGGYVDTEENFYTDLGSVQNYNSALDAETNNRIVGDNSLDSDIQVLRSQVNGLTTGYVFDTYADMQTAIADSSFVANFKIGDNLYIRDANVPDYWWDGVQALALETPKADLSNYYVKSDVDAKDAQAVSTAAQYTNNQIASVNANKLDKTAQAADSALFNGKTDNAFKTQFIIPRSGIDTWYKIAQVNNYSHVALTVNGLNDYQHGPLGKYIVNIDSAMMSETPLSVTAVIEGSLGGRWGSATDDNFNTSIWLMISYMCENTLIEVDLNADDNAIIGNLGSQNEIPDGFVEVRPDILATEHFARSLIADVNADKLDKTAQAADSALFNGKPASCFATTIATVSTNLKINACLTISPTSTTTLNLPTGITGYEQFCDAIITIGATGYATTVNAPAGGSLKWASTALDTTVINKTYLANFITVDGLKWFGNWRVF